MERITEMFDGLKMIKCNKKFIIFITLIFFSCSCAKRNSNIKFNIKNSDFKNLRKVEFQYDYWSRTDKKYQEAYAINFYKDWDFISKKYNVKVNNILNGKELRLHIIKVQRSDMYYHKEGSEVYNFLLLKKSELYYKMYIGVFKKEQWIDEIYKYYFSVNKITPDSKVINDIIKDYNYKVDEKWARDHIEKYNSNVEFTELQRNKEKFVDLINEDLNQLIGQYLEDIQ